MERMGDLDDDLAFEARVVGEEYRRHAASAQLPLYAIAAVEDLAREVCIQHGR